MTNRTVNLNAYKKQKHHTVVYSTMRMEFKHLGCYLSISDFIICLYNHKSKVELPHLSYEEIQVGLRFYLFIFLMQCC